MSNVVNLYNTKRNSNLSFRRFIFFFSNTCLYVLICEPLVAKAMKKYYSCCCWVVLFPHHSFRTTLISCWIQSFVLDRLSQISKNGIQRFLLSFDIFMFVLNMDRLVMNYTFLHYLIYHLVYYNSHFSWMCPYTLKKLKKLAIKLEVPSRIYMTKELYRARPYFNGDRRTKMPNQSVYL